MLPCDPPILILGIYTREMKPRPHKNLHMNVHNGTIHDSLNTEKTTQQPLAHKWINKMYFHPYKEIAFICKTK